MAFALGAKAIASGYRLAAYDTIGSTNTEALERAKRGDAGRIWVVARAQSAGHGRRGRPWETDEGNLAASLLMRLPASQAGAATLGFAAGLALEAAIGAVAPSLAAPTSGRARGSATASLSPPPETGLPPLAGFDLPSRGRLSDAPSAELKLNGGLRGTRPRLQLKWPNDVLVDGAKVAGILLEAVTQPGGPSSIVIGIGVNVQSAPSALSYPAISLAECGAETDPEQLFEALSDAWTEQEETWDGGRGFATIRNRWLERAAGLGRPIAVQLGSDVFRGTFETIDEEGRLVVRAADGSARSIAAGEVHFGAAATAGRI